MSGRFLNRLAELTLARPQSGEYFKAQPNAIRITDLRLDFSITKAIGEKPNDCSITVFNLSDSARAEFIRKPLRIELLVGYKDTGVSRLFVGDMRFGHSMLDKVDWVTKLQLGDGDRAFNHAHISRSYKGGVSLRTAVTDVAASMGLRVPKSLDDFKEMAQQFSGGLTLEGPSQAQLTKLLRARGMQWSIQDGSMQVLRAGDVRNNEAIVVSQQTGLVGTPDYGAPKEPGTPPTLSARMLLYPGLIPGGKVKVETASIKGLFRVERVQHVGSTHGPDWYSSFEARPL